MFVCRTHKHMNPSTSQLEMQKNELKKWTDMWMMLQSRLSFLDTPMTLSPAPSTWTSSTAQKKTAKSATPQTQACSTSCSFVRQHWRRVGTGGITIRSCRNWRKSRGTQAGADPFHRTRSRGSEHLLEGEITDTWGWTEPKSGPWLAAQVPNRDHHLSASRHYPVVHLSPNGDHEGAHSPLGGRNGGSLRKEEWQVHGGVS